MELNQPPHATGIDAILHDLDVKIDRGLDARDVEQRRARFGPNRLPPPPRRSILRRLLDQLKSPLVLALILAAAVSLVVATMARDGGSVAERYVDAFAILLIVVPNAALGLAQARKADAALAALGGRCVRGVIALR